MKELSVTEVQAISGAGKIQDCLSAVFSDLFNDATRFLNNVFGLGYEAESAQQAGLDFGSRLGKNLEERLTGLLADIQNKIIG